MKKKIATLLLAFAIFLPCVFMLTACGPKNQEQAKVTGISVELVSTNYTLLNNAISVEWGELIRLTAADFKVTATFDDNSTSQLPVKTADQDGYVLISTLPTTGDVTEIGDYTLTFTYADVQSKVINVHVVKKIIDVSTLTWSENEFVYDGTQKLVSLNNLPQGVEVTYEGEKATNAGNYTAVAVLSPTDDDHIIVVPSTLSHSWKINKASVDVSGVKLKNEKTFTYSGEEQALAIADFENIPANVNVEIAGEKQEINAGEYTAILKFTYNGDNAENYAIDDKNISWKINKAELTDNTPSNFEFDFNGKNKFNYNLLLEVDVTGFKDGDNNYEPIEQLLSFDEGESWFSLETLNFEEHKMIEAGTYNLGYRFVFENYETQEQLVTITINPTYAKIAGTYYTLHDAVEYANTNGGSISLYGDVTLLENITLTERILIEKDVTLDLNGHSITYTGEIIDSGVVIVKRGATLTINDGDNEANVGGIYGTNKAYSSLSLTLKGETEHGEDAKLIVNAGNFSGDYYGIVGNGNRHDTEIIINGGNFFGTHTQDNIAIYHPQNGKLTINAGTFTGYASAIELRAGELVVNGGTFVSTAQTFSATKNGNGSTIVGAALAISQHNTNLKIDATINAGTFTGLYAIYEADMQDDLARENISVVVTDEIEGQIYSENCPGISNVGVKTATQTYHTLKDAIDSISTTGTVTLLENITLTERIYIEKDVTLDLNGHSITYTGEIIDSGVLVVKRGATLTVNDGDNQANVGGIYGTDKAYASISLTAKGETEHGEVAKLVVNAGNFSGDYYGIVGNGNRHDTEIIINGGNFYGTHTQDNIAIYHPQNGKLTINAGTFTGYASAIELRAGELVVNGGTFVSTSQTFSATKNGNGSTIVGAALAISQHNTNLKIDATINAGTFTGVYAIYEADMQDDLARENISVVVANGIEGQIYSENCPAISNVGVKTTSHTYHTLKDAVDSISTSGTVTLLENITLTERIYIEKDVTLDLNGHSITYVGEAVNSGVLVVKRGATLTVNDGDNQANVGGIYGTDKAYASISLTAKGETEHGENAKLIVNAGNFSGDYYGIVGNGSRHDTEITINGGNFYGTHTQDNIAIYHPQDGKLTINAGTFTGYASAIELRAGELVVNGGTFVSTSQTFSATKNGNGSTIVGAALAISQHNTNLAIDAKINAGTFTGVYAIYEADMQDDLARENISVVVTDEIEGQIYSENCPGISNVD